MRIYVLCAVDNFFRSSEKYWSYNCNNKWTGNDDFALTNVHFYLHSFAFDSFFVENDDLWSCLQSNIHVWNHFWWYLWTNKKGKKLPFFVFHSSSERFNSRTLKMLQWQNRPYYHYYYWNVIQLVHNLWDDVRLALKMGKHYNGEFIGMRWKRVSLIQIK